MTDVVQVDELDGDWIKAVSAAAPSALPTVESALGLGTVEWAYSPGQKRDNVGRFGSGGGRAPSAAPDTASDIGGPGVAGRTPDGEAGNVKISRHLKAGTPAGLYRDGAAKVGADLDAQFPPERLAAAAASLNPGARMVKASTGLGDGTPGEQIADKMHKSWISAAYDEQSPTSLAIQVAVSREFGTGLGKQLSFRTSHGDLDHGVQKGTEATWGEKNGYDMPVLQAAVRSMHTHTQKQLDDLGVGETVTLFRGSGAGQAASFRNTLERQVDYNPASSFTTSPKVALTYAGKGGVFLTMTVPRRRIIAMPGTGMGAVSEAEILVARGKGDRTRGDVIPGPKPEPRTW